MSTVQIVWAVIIPVVSGLIIMIFVFMWKRASKFFASIAGAIQDIDSMKKDSELRKEESIMNLDGMFIMMDAMKGEKINGNVELLRERYRAYTNKKAVG